MSSAITKPGYHAGRVAPNRGQKFPPEVLSADEVKALLSGCSNRAPSGIRNRALIAVMYRAGLRLSEAIALSVKDIDPVQGTISALHGKGDRSRTVGLDPGAMAMVLRWIEQRKRIGLNAKAPLFCTLAGKPLKPSYIRTMLPRVAAGAGIEKRVPPHDLRHTHAFELMMEGVPVPIIQRQLGHASLATTDVYLRHLAPSDVIAAMQGRQWTL